MRAFVEWMKEDVKSGRYDEREEAIQKLLAA
jgi:Arc/MetJ-type ribon-helix-helix transcriptional regulator